MPGRRGGSLYLRSIVPYLRADIAVCGLQPAQEELGGSETRSFDEISERLAEVIVRRRNPQGVFLLGYSFAGYVAFDVACKLTDRGITVDRLILLDTSGPTLRRQRNSSWQQVRKLAAVAIRPTSAVTGAYLYRKAERFGNSIRKRLGLAAADRLSASQLRARQLYSRAIERHQFKVFAGRIDLVQCTRGKLLSLEPPANGWLPWAAGGVEIHQVAATHATLLRPPHMTAVADIISNLTNRKQKSRAAA
ncbi:MAG: thioesterase domain-containing protein [Pirellulales bacterium]